MEQWKIIILTLIGILNLYTFILYYKDKQMAKRNGYRISEKKLLRSTYFFGGIGALIGMYGLRHKTKHFKFKISILIGLIIVIGIIFFVIKY